MCILFAYVNRLARNTAVDKFRLILINNRDEYLFRPAVVASFIDEHNLYGKLF